jgi:hypothetical protein
MGRVRSHRLARWLAPIGALVLTAGALAGCRRGAGARIAPSGAVASEAELPSRVLGERLIWHPVHLDEQGKLLPWLSGEAPFARVQSLAWQALEHAPRNTEGKPAYFAHSMFEGSDPANLFVGNGWPHNPAGLAAMLVDSALRWYAFSGDERARTLARELVDHVLAHGLTEATDDWVKVPYASADAGSLEYRGADDTKPCEHHDHCGRGDGVGILEPDKIGELGHALVMLWEATDDARYRDAAVACADALAKHVAPGDATHSPWPFRVDAKTGTDVREAYGANVIAPIRLFDELARVGVGDVESYRRAETIALAWLFAQPMKTGIWQSYFEDIPIHPVGENPNQYVALETARWLLQHPERDPDARAHAESIVAWTKATFGADVHVDGRVEPGVWFGAEAIGEQKADDVKMTSHTARFASLLAMLHEATGEPTLRARAFRSFSWATYGCSPDGIVKVGPSDREGFWFTDGYGDYMRHFLAGLGSVPDWAPRSENHLVRSSSVVKRVRYAEGELRYRTFDDRAVDRLVLRAPPHSIKVGALPMPNVDRGEGYSYRRLSSGAYLVDLRRERPGEVRVAFETNPIVETPR